MRTHKDKLCTHSEEVTQDAPKQNRCFSALDLLYSGMTEFMWYNWCGFQNCKLVSYLPHPPPAGGGALGAPAPPLNPPILLRGGLGGLQ